MEATRVEIQIAVSFIGSVRLDSVCLKNLAGCFVSLLPFCPSRVESKATSLQELRQKMRILKVAVQVLETLNGISHGVERNHCWRDAGASTASSACVHVS